MSSDSFEVCILWFKGASGLPLHWSLFVNPSNSTIGNKYDAMAADTPLRPRWEYLYDENLDSLQLQGLGGKVVLGLTEDPATLEEITRRTKLPNMQNENCQNWVWRVVREAVRRRAISGDAATILATVPVNGP
jgi:hypothetical protein